MYSLSRTSNRRKKTCHWKIQLIIDEAILTSPIDFGVADGHRTDAKQLKAFKRGASLLDGIIKKSLHQLKPSPAIDLYAYIKGKGAVWTEKELALLAGHILGTANRLKIDLEWGGNWKSFKDFPHYQLAKHEYK